MLPIKITVAQVNDCLPQTQCQLCTYQGCKPYAEALVNDHDQIDRCLPGGVTVLKKLAALTEQDPAPLITSMQEREKPKLLAVIREAECIGCTKCIQACPVDAILGSAKLMHTIITDECTGCELCIEPCPVDCIDLVVTGPPGPTDKKTAQHYQQRYEFRQQRLAKQALTERSKHRHAKQTVVATKTTSVVARQEFVKAAVAREKARNNK